MPQRSHLLTAAVLASALTAGSAWYFHSRAGRGTDFLTAPSAQKTSPGPTDAANGRDRSSRGKGPSSPTGSNSGHYGRDYARRPSVTGTTGARPSLEAPYGRALPATTPGGRGLFAPSASKNSSGKGTQAGDAVSEAELQWRAAQVEQEANHDLKRLVKLLDLDEDQQDRIFQTLASRSAEWHPLMRATTIFPDFPSDHTGGNNPVATNLPSTPGYDSGTGFNEPSASTGKPAPASLPAPEPPSPGNGNLAVNVPETPLADALASDLTPEQKAVLAEEEMDREEWWESIIPRLLPDEDELESDTDTGSDGVYAAPPDAGTGTGSSSDTTGGAGTSSVSPTSPTPQ